VVHVTEGSIWMRSPCGSAVFGLKISHVNM